MGVYPIDAPSSINAFLASFGSRDGSPSSSEPKNNADDTDEKMDEKMKLPEEGEPGVSASPDQGDLAAAGAQAQSTSSSPACGLRAPPSTPVTHAANIDGLSTLEPIEEVDDIEVLTVLADTQNLTLKDSKFARSGLGHRSYNQRIIAAPRLIFGSGGEQKGKVTPTQTRLTQGVRRIAGGGFVDQVIKNFKSQIGNEADKGRENVRIEKSHLPPPQSTWRSLSSANSYIVGHNSVADDTAQSTEKPDVGFIPLMHKELPESNSQDSRSSGPKLSPQAKEFVAQPSPKIVEISKENHEQVFKAEETSVKGSGATGSSDSEGQESKEDRELRTHFKSWGPPSSRDKPRSRVRKIVLTNLPIDADLTLIQGLIHGGSIDTFTHVPTHALAQVTFVSADVCDKFYDKYPNGLVFRYKGKYHTSFVHKGKEVDVVSGMLQGYLDCGASRCIKAVGADEDWGILALHKLAEGKNGIRKVEAIFDTYRNSLRTIVFRFTNIADAVKFKSVLVRSEEWDACNIQFMDDPCEKATDIHLD